MNKKISIVMFLNILLLTACSKGPTESEAKKIIQSVVDTCPYVTIEKFDKTNAVAVGDGNNYYDVVITYTVKTKVDPEAAKYAEEDAKINAQNIKIKPDLEKQLAEITALRKVHNDEFQQIVNNNHGPDRENQIKENNARGIELETTYSKIDYQLRQMGHDVGHHPPTDALLKCAVISVLVGTDFSEEVTKEFSETIRMVKSDKGWISAK